MMTSYFNLIKYAATGIASPDMTYYDRMRASTLMGGNTVQTLTGQPPLTFKADGTPLISWSMKGNGSQTGTPTPDNPVMPEFVGTKTGNLFDKIVERTLNTFLRADGTTGSSSGWAVTDFIEISGDYVTVSGVGGVSPAICAYDSNKEYVRGTAYNTAGYTALGDTTISVIGCKYVRFSIYYSFSKDIAMLNSGNTALPYEPFGWAEKITCAGQTVPVYLGEVPTVRRVRKLVLDGTENWRKSGDGNIFIALAPNRGVSWVRVLSTHFTSSQIQTNGSLLWFVNANVDFDTVEECKTYLASEYAAGTPVTVWYVLAEPQTAIINEPLAKIGDYADELSCTDAAVTIPTVKGQNVLTVETELQQSEMTITYKG